MDEMLGSEEATQIKKQYLSFSEEQRAELLPKLKMIVKDKPTATSTVPNLRSPVVEKTPCKPKGPEKRSTPVSVRMQSKISESKKRSTPVSARMKSKTPASESKSSKAHQFQVNDWVELQVSPQKTKFGQVKFCGEVQIPDNSMKNLVGVELLECEPNSNRHNGTYRDRFYYT